MNATKAKINCRNVRKYLREYNEVTGIHGLRYLTEKRSRTEKILWAIIVITSLSGCCYMFWEVIFKYNNSPVVVSFKTEDTPIYKIPFPSITICPEAKSSSKKFNYTDIYFKVVKNESATVNATELRYYGYINLLCSTEFWTNGSNLVDDDFFQIIRQLAPEIEMECYMGETSYDYKQLFTPIIIDQGICFSFNILHRSQIFEDDMVHFGDFYNVENVSHDFSSEWAYRDEAGVETYPRRALKSGAHNSFDIYLKYNSNDTDYLCNNFLQGYRILIHTPWDVPHLSNHYFQVPLDKTVVAAVDPSLIITSPPVKRFDPKKRKCYLTDERKLMYFKMYTQSNCLFECLTNYTLEKCGCVQYYMPRKNSTSICGSGNSKCVAAAENELRIKDLENKLHGTSFCDCKPDCTALSYHVETSHSEFYWREYFRVRKQHGFKELDIKNDPKIHWSVLSIYLKSEQFMTLERNELFGTSDLISNFGGLLGLFTGFSLISLAEIIYFLSLRIFCNQRIFGVWSGQ